MATVTVTMAVNPANSGIILSNGSNVNSITVESGSTVTWQATPETGYTFDHFVSAEGATTTQNPVTFPVTKDGSMTAIFTLINPPVYHNVCQNNICTKIEGTGTDECTNLNAACPVTPTTNNTAIILIAAFAAGFLIFRRK